jgi:putative transposase
MLVYSGRLLTTTSHGQTLASRPGKAGSLPYVLFRVRPGGAWKSRIKRNRFRVGQIIRGIREAKVRLSQGKSVSPMSRELGITEQTNYRWRRKYGGMKISRVWRSKEFEQENAPFKRAVAELTLDKVILKEALEGNY